MNREALEARLKEVDEAISSKQAFINQFVADMNVLQGHKVEVNHWLAKLNESEKPEVVNPECVNEVTLDCADAA